MIIQLKESVESIDEGILRNHYAPNTISKYDQNKIISIAKDILQSHGLYRFSSNWYYPDDEIVSFTICEIDNENNKDNRSKINSAISELKQSVRSNGIDVNIYDYGNSIRAVSYGRGYMREAFGFSKKENKKEELKKYQSFTKEEGQKILNIVKSCSNKFPNTIKKMYRFFDIWKRLR